MNELIAVGSENVWMALGTLLPMLILTALVIWIITRALRVRPVIRKGFWPVMLISISVEVYFFLEQGMAVTDELETFVYVWTFVTGIFVNYVGLFELVPKHGKY